MADVYSVNFIAAAGMSTSASYTVPDGYVAVVTTIDWFFGSEIDPPYAEALGEAGQCFSYAGTDPLTPALVSWRGRHVLTAGESFSVECLVGNVDVTACGYLLTAV